MEVLIDKVLYVPVVKASIDTEALIGALIRQWYGDNWIAHQENALRYLRVVVSDRFRPDEGQSIPEFVAMVLEGVAGWKR